VRLLTAWLVTAALVLTACSGSTIDTSDIPDLPVTSPREVAALLAASDKPVVLNIWASWCLPCRSEAPLLDQAATAFENEVTFIGINVRDSQDGAKRFIAEFYPGAPIQHLFDRRGDVPRSLGGNSGVPTTFFFAPGGQLVKLHFGVIDERTLALQIDELLAR